MNQRIAANSFLILAPLIGGNLTSRSSRKVASCWTVHTQSVMPGNDDIAYGVLYLASDEAKFVTGTELVIDGGYTAQWRAGGESFCYDRGLIAPLVV